MTEPRLRVSQGPVGRIELTRPDGANAIDLAFAIELEEAVAKLGDTRVVVITAQGRQFCAGGDLKTFATFAPAIDAHILEVTEHLHRALVALAALPAPVVVAIQGAAAGAGLGLVCGADIAIAAESAKFVMAYTGAGLTPDASTSWWLPRLVGPRLASDMTLTNRVLSAADALAAGLVSRVVPDGDLAEETDRVVAALADGPTAAFAASKRLLRSELDLVAHLEVERQTLAASTRTADGLEGIAAFAARRPPRFGGA